MEEEYEEKDWNKIWKYLEEYRYMGDIIYGDFGEVMFTITESGSELFSVGDTFEFYD